MFEVIESCINNAETLGELGLTMDHETSWNAQASGSVIVGYH
jgi:hypothetical protein